ncbi:MAG: hypothetical protein IT168_06430 [Bryobacterales bacterium]|nr:hypothetical protein [Bryobacterales bacterium]
MHLSKDLREFVELLNSNEVEKLIRNKESTNRAKDRADAEELRKRQD